MQEMPPRQQVNGSETIRMGQPGGLPNFNDPNEAGDDAAYGEVPSYGTLARRTQAGDDAQLAILKAFQDYVERERQRAQRRTNTVISACAVLPTVLVAGFFAIWFSTMHGAGMVLSADISDEDRLNIFYRNGDKILSRFPWYTLD